MYTKHSQYFDNNKRAVITAMSESLPGPDNKRLGGREVERPAGGLDWPGLLRSRSPLTAVTVGGFYNFTPEISLLYLVSHSHFYRSERREYFMIEYRITRVKDENNLESRNTLNIFTKGWKSDNEFLNFDNHRSESRKNAKNIRGFDSWQRSCSGCRFCWRIRPS